MLALMLVAPLILAGGAVDAGKSPALTDKQAARLEKELEGLEAGTPLTCISTRPQSTFRVISDTVVLYRVSSRLIYKNEVLGVCSGLTRAGNTLITRSWSTQQCRGDMATVTNLKVGVPVGYCSLGAFVPYTRPKK